MEVQKESILKGYPNIISYECTKKIMEQMSKNICKINMGEEQGTGFFCKIPFPDINNMLSVFITNNHIINRELLYTKNAKIKIDIREEKDFKEINLDDRMKYTNEEYDITIIEIKEIDDIKYYLELDDNIIEGLLDKNNYKNNKYENNSIYIIQYPKGKLSVSYGIIDAIYLDKNYNFNHKCSTDVGSSGSPILNFENKIIGIHKEGVSNKYNKGTFLYYPIQEFIELNSKKNEINNENEMLLEEFNKKYNLNIRDKNIPKLDLRGRKLGNEIFEELIKLEFIELKKLNLYINNISDIKELEKVKFENLEKLNLSYNKIADINILEKVNFKELKELDLKQNIISDIKVLEKVNFKKLEILNLSHNKITDINVLEKVNFKV